MGREQRANTARREAIGKIASAIAGRAVDEGELIQIGFAAMIHATYPNWERMPLEQRDQLRMAFFGGAQHLWGSVFNFLEPGEEPTEKDLRRFDLIAHELNTFIEEWKQRHNITDPDIGPMQETKQ
jgi:hypothetical protein